jgi:hypothetical protein
VPKTSKQAENKDKQKWKKRGREGKEKPWRKRGLGGEQNYIPLGGTLLGDFCHTYYHVKIYFLKLKTNLQLSISNSLNVPHLIHLEWQNCPNIF